MPHGGQLAVRTATRVGCPYLWARLTFNGLCKTLILNIKMRAVGFNPMHVRIPDFVAVIPCNALQGDS